MITSESRQTGLLPAAMLVFHLRRLFGCDDEARHIAYTIVEGRFAYHHGSVQVFPHERGSRVVWVSDILPDTSTESSSAMMDRGSEAMVRTLTADVGSESGS